MEKVAKVRKAILNLVDYNLPDLKDVSQSDYELIKLSVINSIKGEAIAREERGRQSFVDREFLKPAESEGLLTYRDTSEEEKCDFEGDLNKGPHFGLEVKGGEGNSLTLLSRPPMAGFFVVWSFLDVMSNTPGRNMRAVLARIVKLMVNNNEKREHVDCLVFYDEWYKLGVKRFKSGKPLPDVILLPSRTPTRADPEPPVHSPMKTPFLDALYKVVGKNNRIDDTEVKRHIWLARIKVLENKKGTFRELDVRNWHDPNITLMPSSPSRAYIKAIDKV